MSSVTEGRGPGAPSRMSPGSIGAHPCRLRAPGRPDREPGRRAARAARRRRGRGLRAPGDSARGRDPSIPCGRAPRHRGARACREYRAPRSPAPRRRTARAESRAEGIGELLALVQATRAMAEPVAREQRVGRQEIDEIEPFVVGSTRERDVPISCLEHPVRAVRLLADGGLGLHRRVQHRRFDCTGPPSVSARAGRHTPPRR